jgi:tetratricopeptide (TPR) repeat protein
MDNDAAITQAPEELQNKNLKTQFLSFDSCYTICLVALVITAFYIICSTPLCGWRDGPEFAVTATYLDVAHPSGFPTYSLMAKVATWLPLGSIGFRVTIFTAFAGGMSLFILALLLKRLHKLETERPPALAWLFAPILILALDKAVFVSSTELEVYSLHTFFIVILFYCATRWHEGSGIKWLYVGGFLYGLSAGNHGSMCLYLPVLLLLTFYGEPKEENDGSKLRHLKRISFLILFFIIGLSVYLYLIIRSNTNHLPVDFGRPSTWHRFWLHISDAKDSDYHFKGLANQEELFYLVKVQIQNLLSPIFWPSILLSLWGLRFLWKKFQIMSVALVLLILINVGFFYYWIDGSAAFIPSICAYTILVSLGMGELGRYIIEKKLFKWITSAAMVIIVSLTIVLMGKERLSESETFSGYQSFEFFYPDLANAPPQSILIHHAGWLSLLSLQYVYAVRPDASLVLMSGFQAPNFMPYPRPETQPLATFPRDSAGSLISPFSENYIQMFLNANLDSGKRVLIQYGEAIDDYLPYLKPNREFMWMGELKQDNLAGWNSLHNGDYTEFLLRSQKYFETISTDPNTPFSQKSVSYLFYIHRPVLHYTLQNHLYKITADTAKKFLDLFAYKNGRLMLTQDVMIVTSSFYADALKSMGKYSEARNTVNTLIKLRPSFPLGYNLLALIYEKENKGQDAITAWEKAYKLDPYSAPVANKYFLAIARYKSITDAINFMDSHIDFLDKAGLNNMKKSMQYLKSCLLLKPDEPFPPDGDHFLQLYYTQIQASSHNK